MISIHMLKLCGDSVWKPLEIIFKNCLQEGLLPHEWKKANAQKLINKKNDPQKISSNYQPVSLLPVCSKIFESCIYNSMYRQFDNNLLISKPFLTFLTKPGTKVLFMCCTSMVLLEFNDFFNQFSKQQKTNSSFKCPAFFMGRHLRKSSSRVYSRATTLSLVH